MDLLNSSELAQLLKLSKSCIYKKTMNNQIPFIKVGRKVLFNRQRIEEWLESKTQATQDEVATDIHKILKSKNL